MAPGKQLNQYEVTARIGAGGMGEVYRARDTRLGRDVALKVLHRRYSDDPESRRRLENEARLVAQLAHPNIGAIHGLEEADGVIFLVLELVDGVSLAQKLEGGPLAVRESLETAAQIAAAVSEAHRRGILHRDLKPSNIMVDDEGRVRVLDFGLATCGDLGPRADAAGGHSSEPGASDRAILAEEPTAELRLGALDDTLPATDDCAASPIEGTPVYMSPEQVRGEALDRHSDVWAVGCVLFEMLTGERPFEGGTIVDTFDRILERDPDWRSLPESTPESVQVLLCQMLEKKPRRRIADLGDASVLLERAISLMTGSLAAHEVGRRNRASLGLGAVVLVAAAGLAGATLAGSPFGDAADPGFDSIAVLPFENLTGDPGRDYFADGMTEELTTELGRIEALKVVSRSSVRAFDGEGVALPEMARQLGVRTLIEASLLGGEGVRLSVRLYDAVEDVQLWGETYESAAGDIESLCARAAQAIAVKLGIELTAEEKALLASTTPVDPEASAAYLDGRYWANAGRGQTAIDSFRSAVDIDPGYAAAWAALASAYVYRLPSDEHMPLARHAAQTALNLDETLGEAHAALAQVRFFFDWDWKGADSAFQRALALAPSNATIRQRYAGYLWAVGRIDEARRQLERAEELDPMSLFIKLELARSDYFKRDYDTAIDAYHELLQRDRDFWWAHLFLGISYQQADRLDESATELIAALDMLRDDIGAALQAGFDEGGYEGLMRAWIGSGEQNPRVQPTSLVAQNAFIGNTDEAFRWLEVAFEKRTRALVWIAVDPQYDVLRQDPRFENLLRRMGLSG